MKKVNLKITASGGITAGDPRMQPGPVRQARGKVSSAIISVSDVPDDVDIGSVIARASLATLISPLDGPYTIVFDELRSGQIIRAPKKQTIATNLRLAGSTHAGMVRLAEKNGRSLNSEIEMACKRHLAISGKVGRMAASAELRAKG